MKTRSLLRFALIILLAFTSSATFAASIPNKKQTAETFLASIYDHYKGDPKTANGIFLDSDLGVKLYFTPSMADLIINDDADAKKRDEVPRLDGDPFVDAQEWKIDSIDIHVQHQGKTKADATVRFVNFDKPKEIRLYLIRTKQGWRIDDIFWGGTEGSLRGIYAKK